MHDHILTLLAILAVATSCGGSSKNENGPLKTRFSERYIARIPLVEHRSVIRAEDDLAMARREYARVRAELEASATSLEVARYHLRQAELAKSSARALLRSAQSRAHRVDVRAAEAELAWAEKDEARASAKLQDVRATRAFLQAELRYRHLHERAMEARYELEKARLATRHQIEPEGFSLPEYERQFHSRMARAKAAEIRANQEQSEAERAHSRWLALERGAPQRQRRIREAPASSPEPDAGPPR